MTVIRSVGILSAGKVMGCIQALVGLIAGAFFSLFALAGAALGGGQNAGVGAVVFGAGAIILIPMFYGVLGFITGIIGGALYNAVAGFAGGLEIRMDQNSV